MEAMSRLHITQIELRQFSRLRRLRTYQVIEEARAVTQSIHNTYGDFNRAREGSMT